jgi:hypothetical protein
MSPPLDLRKCYVEHLRLIEPQAAQELDHFGLTADQVAPVLERSLAFSGWIAGECIGAAGILPKWAGVAQVWCLLSRQAPPYMLAITRAVRAILATHEARRFECSVVHDFEQGHRWMRLLGFTNETPNGMLHADPHGRTLSMYSKVRP